MSLFGGKGMESETAVMIQRTNGEKVLIWQGKKQDIPTELAKLKGSYHNCISEKKLILTVSSIIKGHYKRWPFGDLQEEQSTVLDGNCIILTYSKTTFNASYMDYSGSSHNLVWHH